MLIVAATACSSGDSTKVFNAGGESAARPPASSPDLPGSAPNAAGAGATRTSVPGAAEPADKASAGDRTSKGASRTSSGVSAEADGRSVHEIGDDAAETAAEKITNEPVGIGAPAPGPAPSSGPAPRPSLVQRATPPPTAAPGARDSGTGTGTGKSTGKSADGTTDETGEGTDPPMRLAAPARTGPRQVDIVQPRDVPGDPVITDRPAGTAGGPSAGNGTAAGWSGPVLTEDFGRQLDPSAWTASGSRGAGGIGGGTLRLTGGTGLTGRLTQQYGRWEVRLSATKGSGTPVVSLRPGSGGGAEIGLAAIGDPDRQAANAFVGSDSGDRTHGALRADFTLWHTVAVDWLPDRVSVWLDGTRVWDYTGRVPAQRMGVSLRNVCEGSDACGGTLFVDWLRVYRAAQR
ncbi:family 16 glycosylhydrolase [Microbispora sp. NBC_01389]|uniref:family 16 glycosylhydrolase n=1 Tax=Microbispora sp. NBC_01389 TaxID=2903584 RepID=UPI0032438DFD